MSSDRLACRAAVGLFGLLICCGCAGRSGETASAAGSNVTGVLLRKGTPVPDAIVSVFARARPAERLAFATTDAAGRFQLLAHDGKAPATLPPGEYSVTVESLTGALTLPAVFSQPAKTPVHANVEGPQTEWTLELTTPSASKKK
jgi:hypothetical protein